MKTPIVAPSLLAADFLHLEEELDRVQDAGVKWLHFDVMDGHFVSNISFGSELLKKLKSHYDFIYDVHIMVTNPEAAAGPLVEAGADFITFHYEASDDPMFTIMTLRNMNPNLKVGMSIKPETPVDEILEFLPEIDLVLVMSVEPGKGGQEFNIDAIDKIEELRNFIDENELSCLIEVDGGINSNTGPDAVLAGADVLVAGTYIFKSSNIEDAIYMLKPSDEY